MHKIENIWFSFGEYKNFIKIDEGAVSEVRKRFHGERLSKILFSKKFCEQTACELAREESCGIWEEKSWVHWEE